MNVLGQLRQEPMGTMLVFLDLFWGLKTSPLTAIILRMLVTEDSTL